MESCKIAERLSDLRESFVEVFVVARVQNRVAAGFDSDGAVAVKLGLGQSPSMGPMCGSLTTAHSIGDGMVTPHAED
jgi:hypothetical protein